jgi:HK97 family phage major capsid protein
LRLPFAQFVRDELIFGLLQALEGQLLSGNRTAPNLEGILTTTGVLNQAYATDLLTTTRKGITTLESAGLEPTGYVLSPEGWEKIELSRTSGSGEPEMLDSPVDRAARRMHGVPVGVAPSLAAGQGILLSRDSVFLRVDAGVQIRWSENVSDDFQKNQVRARAEVRAATQIQRPTGVVVLDLDAAA